MYADHNPTPEQTRLKRIRRRKPKNGYLPIVLEVSAGGVCVRISDGVAFVAAIARRNRNGDIEWCLPKGHIEAGENAIEAAVREVAEETGIHGRVIRSLCSIDYWFSTPKTRVHKTVHHFLLEYVSGDPTVEFDPDHEAEDAAWIPLLDATKRLAYPNERRVIRAALKLLFQDN